jgi:hypothetical protein
MTSTPHQILPGWSNQQEWDGWSTWHGQERCVQGFGGETWRKKTPVRPRRRWQYNVEIDLEEVGWRGTDWIEQAHDKDRLRAVVNAVMNLRVLRSAGNFLIIWRPVSSSGRTLLCGVRYYLFVFSLHYRLLCAWSGRNVVANIYHVLANGKPIWQQIKLL